MTDQSHEVPQSFRAVRASSERKFGVVVGLCLCAIAVLPPLLHGRPIRLWLLAPGLCLAVLGLAAPRLLAPLNRGWFGLGLVLGRVSNPVVMAVLFFGVLAPIGWILRLRGMDLLSLRRDDGVASYWVERGQADRVTALHKQF